MKRAGNGATTWRGRRGAMLLGPTEDRVARYLADLTGNGRITIRTVDLIAALGLERSEAYRILRRLRELGLFGVENDQGGTKGGRRIWRTPIEHDGARLDAQRHRIAWSRILAWARARQADVADRLERIRNHTSRPGIAGPSPRTSTASAPAAATDPAAAGESFAEHMRRAGLAGLMAEWGLG